MTIDEEKVVDAEAQTTEVKEEKKEGSFKKFWNKTKKTVGDAVLENKIESTYKRSNNEYSLYQKDELLGKTLYGVIEGNTLTCWGKPDVKEYSVVVDNKTNTAYYVLNVAEGTVKAIVDAVEYERDGLVITLTSDVTEVNVIKAGKRYFLYKGK